MDEQAHSTTTPWRRDPADVADGLAAWVSETLGPDAQITEFAAPDNGMSSETVLFTVRDGGADHRYVARLAPAESLYPVFPEYDLDLQRRCMQLVARHTSVPVPEVPWYEADPRWIGSPFLVMGRIDGVVPTDNPPYVFGGWLMDASPRDRRRLQDAAVQTLVDLHAVSAEHVDLSFLARPEHGDTPLRQQVGYQRWYYDWAREGTRYELIEDALDWLERRMPEEREAVLNWGDSRIGNMLWRDFSPVAVLDWEMAAVGPPEVDVAWMIFLHRFFQDLAERFGMPGIPGFMERADVVETYERLSGREVRDLEWYEMYAATRFAIVSIRTSIRGIAYGLMEPPADRHDVIMFRGLFEQMLDGSYWDTGAGAVEPA